MAEPYKVLFVDPTTIRSYTRRFEVWQAIGGILDGDWDEDTHPHDEHPKFRAVESRYLREVEWEHTGLFPMLLEGIRERGHFDGCSSLEEIRRRYELLDATFEDMKKHGFDTEYLGRAPDQVSRSLRRWWSHSRHGYIGVGISRDGEFIHVSGGNHRLSIAKVLKLDRIPVLVLMRHRRWQELRDHIASAQRAGRPRELDEAALRHIQHPDMADLNPGRLVADGGVS